MAEKGRPEKQDYEKHSKRICVSFTEGEWEFVKRKMENSDVKSISEQLRMWIIDGALRNNH